MNKFFIIFLLLILLAACSNKELYQAGKSYQKSECINQAQTAEQHTKCNSNKSKSYEEYEKERKNIVNK